VAADISRDDDDDDDNDIGSPLLEDTIIDSSMGERNVFVYVF
jgi:hypothetical protein